MPIPQISKKRKDQRWRTQKKKYYVSNHLSNAKKRTFNKKKSFGSLFFRFIFSKIFLKFVLFSIITLGVFGTILIAWLSRGLPDPNRLMDRQIAQSTKIYDRTGETILYEIYGDEKRTLINLKDIPEYVKWATISVEDKDFYKHGGFSVWAMFRTMVTNILRGQKAGGSTLTQQFIKNAVLSPEKTYTRKIKELILAQKLEKKFSKDDILQMYLNEIPYGSTAYGIEAASQRYFGKSVYDINLAEAALLAALPQAPSRYSPYGANRDLLIQRQHYILDLMVKYGYTTEPKAEAAKQYDLEFKKQSNNIIAPHFVMYIKEILSEKYGEKMVEQDGLRIYTTLDLYKQEIAEEIIRERTEVNKDKYNAENAALVSIDPKTGQILAMVGSRDYFDEEIDGQVNIATSKRQPGSSMKPLVYAAAFTKGYTPNTILYDVVTNFSNDSSEPYEPHNYDNQEHGPVSIRKALAGSLNIPAVKAIYLAGINNVLDFAQNLGYTTLNDRDRFGLSLVLGGGEVKLLEHVNAFSAFAREGNISPLSSILRIEDKDGKIIEEFKEEKKKKVLDGNIARMINDILSDNNARAYAFGTQNWLTLGSRPVAAKTGTTNDYRDAWTIGYTPSIITGVWAGNNDNSAMKRGAAGGSVAAPIWHDFMAKILGDTPVEEFKKPDISETGKSIIDGKIDFGEVVKIDIASGLLATEYTPENFIKEVAFNKDHCILYYVDKENPLGEKPKNPEKDPQFELWESRVLEWAEKKGISSTTSESLIDIPTEYDNLHNLENRPEFKIITPENNQIISEPFIVVRIEGSAPRGINRAEYYINNNLLYSNNSFPFNLEKRIDFLNNGFHNLKVRVCDDVDNCSEQSIEFNLITENKEKKEEISVSFFELSNGLAVNDFDFPIDLNIKANNKEQIAKIDIYLLNKENNENFLIGKIEPVENDLENKKWNIPPSSGTYELYLEAIGWNGQVVKSEKTTITVNNTR